MARPHRPLCGFPTNLVVDVTGKKLAEVSGYVQGGPNAFLVTLQKQT